MCVKSRHNRFVSAIKEYIKKACYPGCYSNDVNGNLYWNKRDKQGRFIPRRVK